MFLNNKKEREKFDELSNFGANNNNKYMNIFKKGNNGKIMWGLHNTVNLNLGDGLPPNIVNINTI